MNIDDDVFMLKAKPRNLLAVNIISVILGGIIIYLISRVPHYGKTFFMVSLPLLIIWLVGDVWVWNLKGVRELHISKEGIKVVRGVSSKVTFITPGEITDVHLHSSMNRKSLNILLGKKVVHIPGIYTYYPGKKLHLFSDAFDDKEFDQAVERIFALTDKKNTDEN